MSNDLKGQLEAHHGQWRYYDGQWTIFTTLPEKALERITELEAALEQIEAQCLAWNYTNPAAEKLVECRRIAQAALGTASLS